MKEYLKTNRFCISVERFKERLDDLSLWLTPFLGKGIVNGGTEDKVISATIDELSFIVDETENKGNEIIEEVIEACPDELSFPNQLKTWLDNFDRQIGNPLKPDLYWVSLTHSITKGKMINSLISRMLDNIENVAECVRYYANKYDVDIDEITTESGTIVDSGTCKEEEVNSNQEQIAPQEVPTDIIRLFGSYKKQYHIFINACKGQQPKKIATLYREYGKIQIEQEKGVVTAIYNHLRDLGLLSCGLRNFQYHYKSV